MEKLFLEIKSEAEMLALARRISLLARGGDVITLNGNLGVGKTVFARGFIKSLTSESQNVVSPTFNLVQMYNAKDFDIWHFDLYRLENESDLYEIGIDDAFDNGVSLIEWPDLAKSFIKKERLTEISIEIIDENTRKVAISGRIRKEI